MQVLRRWATTLLEKVRTVDTGEPDWRPMDSAPRNATEIQVKMADGTVIKPVHWAEDLSGEWQPAFRGWFKPGGGKDGFVEIEEPALWAPMEA
jgi:hypothetical protein